MEHPDPAIFDTIIEAVVKIGAAHRLLLTRKKTTERLVRTAQATNYQGRWYLLALLLRGALVHSGLDRFRRAGRESQRSYCSDCKSSR